MRTRLILIAALIFGTMLTMPATASATVGDSVSGSAVIEDWAHCPFEFDALLVISAQGSTGQAATGLVSVACGSSPEVYESTVSCLDVQGAVATIGMTVTTSTSAAIPAGTEMSLTVTDGGSGGAGDAISVLVSGSNCSYDDPNHPVASGDIVVTEGPDVALPECSDGTDNDADGLTDYAADPGCQSAQDSTEAPNPAPPAVGPTSKTDCEKGGYVKYGFKTQGTCVSYVTSKGH